MSSTNDLLAARYYRPGEKSWKDIVNRVAGHLYPHNPEAQAEAFGLMASHKFVPSSPVLMNAGSRFPMMCSCFVLPVHDSISALMESLTDTVMIQKYGGGVGLNFSAIRPEGSIVSTTNGRASGPVSFAGFWNEAMQVIRQGGKRQGAMMGVLNFDHQDLPLFLMAKEVEGKLTNFNLSVGLTQPFFDDLLIGGHTVWPHGMSTLQVLDAIASRAWHNGEPGWLYLDNINKRNPYGVPIEATNPCGEAPLPPYGACCLGSMNLARYVLQRPYDTGSWEFVEDEFRRDVATAVLMLNKVLDTTWWPVRKIREFEEEHRPIGLGLMGLADGLARLGLPYASAQGREFATKVMGIMREEAEYTNWKHRLGNKTLLSVAPTGSIAMLSGCSYSIEPFFNFSAIKKVEAGEFATEVQALEDVADAFRYQYTWTDKVTIAETGSVQDTRVPKDMKEVLRTATEMKWEDHLLMQAAVQKHVDSAVSKTVNMPNSVSVEDVKHALLLGHDIGLKGMTVYRSASRVDEVIACPTGTCPL